MIPSRDIIEWSDFVPWTSNEQVEQDLVISRSLVELFTDEIILENLAFRGGTAIHKLFLSPQPRYSEDSTIVSNTIFLTSIGTGDFTFKYFNEVLFHGIAF